MKKLFTILAVLFVSLNLNAIQFDSCMVVPRLYVLGTFNDSHNQDSALVVDTCGLYEKYRMKINVNIELYDVNFIEWGKKYKKFYSKGLWCINYPDRILFETTGLDLDNTYFFTIENLKNTNQAIIDGFTDLQKKYGKLEFYLPYSRSGGIKNPLSHSFKIMAEFPNKLDKYRYYIVCENFINSYNFNDDLNKIEGILASFQAQITTPLNVEDDRSNKLMQEKISILVDEKCNTIEIINDNPIHQISLYSVNGIKISTIDKMSNNKFDISNLPSGLYFVCYENEFEKFIIMR